jgi:hypothetical protein
MDFRLQVNNKNNNSKIYCEKIIVIEQICVKYD